MKNALIYNYNLADPKMFYTGDKIFIVDNNSRYELIKVEQPEQLSLINQLQDTPVIENYCKIIKTINNVILMEHNRNKYILIEKKENYKKIIDLLDEDPKKIQINNQVINKKNWYELWCIKNDNIEKAYKLIQGKDKTIDESIDYYLGMAETAISYYKEITNSQTTLTLAHRRIDNVDNPLNIIIDEKERDISEYLKYIFFQNKNVHNEIILINKLIIKRNLSYEKIYARMLYPTYYFDELEKYKKEKSTYKKLIGIIDKIDAYEEYLKKLHKLFSENKAIKKIDWLN